MLEVRDLQVSFATAAGPLHAVRGIDFDLAPGEVLGIVGESGSGKSVTAHALMKLLPANAIKIAGQVSLRGRDVFALQAEELRTYRGSTVSMICWRLIAHFKALRTLASSNGAIGTFMGSV